MRRIFSPQRILSSYCRLSKADLQFFLVTVPFPRPLRERVEFLSESYELRNSGVGFKSFCQVKPDLQI